jgi:hypothetical protein
MYTREQAQNTADSSTVTLYFRKGVIAHKPDGDGWEKIEPAKGAFPVLGHESGPQQPEPEKG